MEPKELEQRVVEYIQRLPPMPENVDRLLQAALNRKTELAEVIELVQNDPGLCTELLHMASACLDTPRQVETIAEAMQEVGPEALVQLIGAFYARETIENEFACLKNLQEYFDHSREISGSCTMLAEVIGVSSHECEMWAAAGLIHDIGRLIIMMAASKTGASLMGTSGNRMLSIVHEESELLGMNHCDVGMLLCRKWLFSPVLQEGVLRHHTPLIKTDFSRLGAIIFLAHFVAKSDFTGEILQKILQPRLLDRIPMTIADFEQAQARYAERNNQANTSSVW